MIEPKNNSCFFDEVVSIKPVGERQTYDFCVPVTNCFFGNGVLVHNSGAIEEDADVVLSLTAKGDHNIGDFHRLMVDIFQRNGASGLAYLFFDPQTGRYIKDEPWKEDK